MSAYRFFLDEARLVLENLDDPQRVKHALDIYAEAIALEPDADTEPYLVLAYFAVQQELWSEAATLLKQALRLDPFNSHIQGLYRTYRTS